MKKVILKNSKTRQVTLEGMMTFGLLENGLRTLDYMCSEDVEAEPFKGDFHVQGMRDGNVYMQQKPKRVRNKPIFRDDNSSLSKGRDGRWYFVFSMSGERAAELPQELVRQACEIAKKMVSYMSDLEIIDRV